MKVGHYENEAMRKYTIYILSIFVVLLVACGEEKEENKTLDSFVTPIIHTYQYDTLVPIHDPTNRMGYRWGLPIDIFRFCSELTLDTIAPQHPSFEEKNLIFLHKNNKILKDDSLRIIVDYNIRIPKRYYQKTPSYSFLKTYEAAMFPAYIINTSSNSQHISTKFGSEIQSVFEAKDENGNWYAISHLYRNMIFCGNGMEPRAFVLPQKHFMLISYYPFYGDFRTKVRMRIKTGEHIYISNEFETNIKHSYFLLQNEDAINLFEGKDSNEVIKNYFLGAKLKPLLQHKINPKKSDSSETSFDGFYNSPIMQSTSAPDISMFPKRIRDMEYAHQAYMDKHYSTRDITEQQSRMRSFYLKEIDSVHKKLYNLLDEEGKQIITKQKRLFDATIQNEHKLFNYFHFHPNGAPGNNFGSAGHYTAYGYTLDALRSRYAELFAYTDFYESILKP